MDRSPTPPPGFPSYVKARWAFAQLRFNSIGKGEEERCTLIRLRAQHMKFKEVHFHSNQFTPIHRRTGTLFLEGLKLQGCVKFRPKSDLTDYPNCTPISYGPNLCPTSGDAESHPPHLQRSHHFVLAAIFCLLEALA